MPLNMTYWKTNRLNALMALFALVLSLSANAAEANPKREIRSVWMATAWAIDYPSTRASTQKAVTAQKNEATQYLDLLKAAGFNCVYFQVRPMADRFYANNSWTDPKTGTKYTVAEPWSEQLTGARGTAPASSFDPLQFWIDEAHARGMELHAWINPYRMNSTLSTAEDKAVSDWIITYDGKKIFNPGLSNTIARIQNVCRVLTGNYDIDGIVFDDYFYPENMCSDTSTSTGDYATYTSYKNKGGTLSIADWRRENVNKMVREVYATIKAIKPWVRFGISPAGAADKGLKPSDGLPPMSAYCAASDWQYASIGADPISWLRDKSIDYISPQLYWTTTHKTNAFGPMSEWWSIAAAKFGRHFYASHSISFLAGANTTANHKEVSEQVRLNRAHTVDGNFGSVIYSATNITGKSNKGLGDVLKAERFQYTSVIPAMTWFDAANPGTVANLTKGSGKLTWTAVDNVRYLAYVIPQSVSRSEATSTDGGLKAEYIIDMTYTNEITIPEGKRKKAEYWYAVSILDRYGNEWALTTLYEPLDEDAEVALNSPKNGITAAESQKFSWSGTAGATFTFEVSADNQFSTIKYTCSGVDMTSTTVNFSTWTGDQTMYWRVRTEKEGYRPAVSDVRSFVTPHKAPFDAPALAHPVNGSVLNADAPFIVEHNNADATILEISRDENFSSIFFSTSKGWYADDEKTWLTYTLPISLLPDGQYYWRARATKEGRDDGISETWTFTVKTGQTAGNYVPARDPDEYDPAKFTTPGKNNVELQLVNLWIRRPDINPIDLDIETHRDMVARSAGDQDRDIIYIISRSGASASATTSLIRYDANTGEKLTPLSLTYDAGFDPGYYPGNGIMLDASNNLLTHTLSLQNYKLSIAKVNPTTGACTTVFCQKVNHRVDHLDVYGTVGENQTYYVYTTASNKVKRWKMHGNTVKAESELTVSIGNAPRARAVNESLAWISGQGDFPTLYNFDTKKAVATFGNTMAEPLQPQATDMLHFVHEGQAYMFYQYSYADSNPGVTWALARGDNFEEGVANAQRMWIFPAGGAGNTKMVSGDWGAPVSIIQHDLTPANVSGTKRITQSQNTTSTCLYGYSPGNALVAYTMVNRILTGIENVTTEYGNVFSPVVNPDATISLGEGWSRYAVYDTAGLVVDAGLGNITAPLTPGFYIIVVYGPAGTQNAKIVLK